MSHDDTQPSVQESLAAIAYALNRNLTTCRTSGGGENGESTTADAVAELNARLVESTDRIVSALDKLTEAIHLASGHLVNSWDDR